MQRRQSEQKCWQKTVAEVRAEVSERLGRGVGAGAGNEIDLMLGREAYVRRESGELGGTEGLPEM